MPGCSMLDACIVAPSSSTRKMIGAERWLASETRSKHENWPFPLGFIAPRYFTELPTPNHYYESIRAAKTKINRKVKRAA
jgi:hypothetical protein